MRRPGRCQAFFLKGLTYDNRLSTDTLAGATHSGADPARIADHRNGGQPMVKTTRFGRKLPLPSVVQIKHQLLLRWLADQTAKEAAEAKASNDAGRPSGRAA